MHISEFDNCLSIKEALKLIKENNSTRYIWYPVINKQGNKFELAGNSNNIRAVIPEYKIDGNIITHPNNMSKSFCTIVTKDDYIHPNDGFTIKDENKFIEYLKNKDLSKLKIVEEEIKVITYEIIKKWKIK